ncbi:MAG: cystathionine gamma-synthase [Wenzhouxiangella sp.]
MSKPAFQASTLAVRAGIESDQQYGAVVPPVHLSSNYTFAEFGQPRQYDYSRSGNPTRDQLGQALAELEGGAVGTITASGMAAIATVLQLLEPGDVLLAPVDCYGGTFRLFEAWAKRGCFELQWVDFGRADELAGAIAQGPAMIWIETPSNPLLRVYDIAAIVGLADQVGALVVADNTFLSPALQQPLALGVDIVVHSTTKYINGHSDVVGGAVVTASATLGEQIRWWANCIGATASPFDSWLTLRGLRTLSARMRVHQENAQAIAERLLAHPAVRTVHYPGLPEHPQHALACRQQRGFGGMVSFELAGGVSAVKRFLSGLSLPSLAESLGGVESLIAHPATMTHAAMTAEARARAGLGDGLLRLSAGLESIDDLLADLDGALAAIDLASRSAA